jgi:tRNA G10  N-methylase Trm11
MAAVGTRGALDVLELTTLHVTGRGRKAEPVHRWYPFAESYSPSFIRAILANLVPEAQRLIDPFAGVGTAPIAAVERGLTAFYCEVNPLLQYLTEVKLSVLRLPWTARLRLASQVRDLAQSLGRDLECTEPDRDLHVSYQAAFGSSVFFEPHVFNKVLRLRTAADRVACRFPLLASLLVVAALCELVPASRVVRAGDLRFRRPEEMRPERPNLEDCVSARLMDMAADLTAFETAPGRAFLACEDARSLSKLPGLGLDGIITSPPYLNGTNYFRNTKLELWFLRSLRKSEDLRIFRDRAVAAGINDVANGRVRAACALGGTILSEVLQDLEARAYDRRIPLMLKSYFADLETVFRALRDHLVPGAQIVVDIGDSIYAGIHVPTDRILSEILTGLGYRPRDQLTTRARCSRNGQPLRQTLLVFERLPDALASPSRSLQLPAVWQRFKENLPHQRHPYSKRNWGHPLHSLCSYAGKIKPSLAAHLIEAFVPEGGRVLDPFAGSGTIPFEATLKGRTAYAFDISPVAIAITSAKIGSPDAGECEQVVRLLEEWIQQYVPSTDEIDRAGHIGFNGRLGNYYETQTFQEILAARAFFASRDLCQPATALVAASLMHILHGNRPYALSRRSHPITPFAPTGRFEHKPLLPALRAKVQRSLAALTQTSAQPHGYTYYQDATLWWPHEVDNLDAVVTSPPFFDSTRFYLANWIRLWFCGWEPEDFQSRPLYFVEERQKRGFEVYEAVFRQARERLKPGGVVVLHLGRSHKCNMALQLTHTASPWFKVLDHFVENVSHCESHGIRDKGTVEEHQYLILG